MTSDLRGVQRVNSGCRKALMSTGLVGSTSISKRMANVRRVEFVSDWRTEPTFVHPCICVCLWMYTICCIEQYWNITSCTVLIKTNIQYGGRRNWKEKNIHSALFISEKRRSASKSGRIARLRYVKYETTFRMRGDSQGAGQRWVTASNTVNRFNAGESVHQIACVSITVPVSLL
jgi:hypothetical protein